MKYRIRHTTCYAYADPVDLASHMLHLSPRALSWQRVGQASLVIEPQPSRLTHGIDHFGNEVAWMFVDRPHDRFMVSVDALVDVGFPNRSPPAPPPAARLAGRRQSSYLTAQWHQPCHRPAPMPVQVFRQDAPYWKGCWT